MSPLDWTDECHPVWATLGEIREFGNHYYLPRSEDYYSKRNWKGTVRYRGPKRFFLVAEVIADLKAEEEAAKERSPELQAMVEHRATFLNRGKRGAA